MSAGSEGTGSRENCVSAWGTYDMVGNVWEWVADWRPASTTFAPSLSADDFNILARVSETEGPGTLVRGGNFLNDATAGVFAVSGIYEPSDEFFGVGLRCVR